MFDSWVDKFPWRRAWKPTTVFLPGDSRGQRNLVGYSRWGPKELDMIEVTEHTRVLSISVQFSRSVVSDSL